MQKPNYDELISGKLISAGKLKALDKFYHFVGSWVCCLFSISRVE